MRRVSLLLWMAPSLEENTVFNEGERKEELPAVSTKPSLFSFASFSLLTGMREAGPTHPCSISSLGLVGDTPRPPRSLHRQQPMVSTNPDGLPDIEIPPHDHTQLVTGWSCLWAWSTEVCHTQPRCCTPGNSMPFS